MFFFNHGAAKPQPKVVACVPPIGAERQAVRLAPDTGPGGGEGQNSVFRIQNAEG
jgi:hypothetical protein